MFYDIESISKILGASDKIQTMRIKIYGIAFGFLGIIASIVLSVHWYRYGTNVFAIHKNWQSEKVLNELETNGSFAFMFGRAGVAQNRVNLSSWHGFQQINYLHSVKPKTILLDVEFEKNSYLNLFLQNSNNRKIAIRFSANTLFPSQIRELGNDNLLKKVYNSTSEIISPGVKHQLVLIFFKNSLRIEVDGKNFMEATIDLGSSTLSMRGADRPVYVERVQIVERDGKTHLEEFHNYNGIWEDIFLISVIPLVVFALFFYVYNVLIRRKRNVYYYGLTSVCLLNLTLLSLFCFDYFYWSKLAVNPYIPSNSNRAENLAQTIERFRQQLLSPSGLTKEYAQIQKLSSVDPVGCLVVPNAGINCKTNKNPKKLIEFLQKTKPNTYKVLISGTSQTIGVGASNIKKSFIVKLLKHISLTKQRPVAFINFAASGGRIKSQHQLFKKHYQTTNADLVIINFGHNDDEVEIKNYLPAYIKAIKQKYTNVVVLEEARKFDQFDNTNNEGHLYKLNIVHSISHSFKIPSIPLHKYMLSLDKYRDLIWWDRVHYTDLGHNLVADYVFSQLQRLEL